MPKKSARVISPYYLAIIAANIIWAGSGPIIKLTLHSVPPFTFLFIRLLIVCLLILPYTIYLLKNSSIVKSDYFKILLLGILGQSSLILLFVGFKYTTALEGTLISMLGCILSVAAGHYYYKEKVDWHIKLGLLIATLGTIFIAIDPLFEIQNGFLEIEQKLFGNFLVILYSLSFLLYVIWSKITLGINSENIKRTLKFIHIKPMKKNYSPLLLMSLSFYIGLASFIPMAILEMTGHFGVVHFTFTNVSTSSTLGILYMSLFSSIAAYYLFEWSLTKVEVKDTAIFSYLQPVLTLPFAYLLLRELPTENMLLGAGVIALGVLIAEEKKT